MKITVQSKNACHEFYSDGQNSLLMSGLSNGLSLPYACATGTCGSCSARIRSGDYADLWETAPGKKKLRNPDEILLCQSAPKTDCEIEVKQSVACRDEGEVVELDLRATMKSWRLLTHNVASWELELSRPITYRAGQFVVLALDGLIGPRAYSMVNYDTNTTRIELLIKKKEGGGFSDELFRENPVGRVFRMTGPLGSSVFRPEIGKNIVCIAGGTGVAGMMSILSHAVQIHYLSEHTCDLFFGVRTARDAFFLERLADLVGEGRRLNAVVCFSEEAAPSDLQKMFPNLNFAQGFVHQVAIEQLKGRLQNAHAFVAGPPPSVDAATRSLVIEGKMSPSFISIDKFE